MFDRFGAVLIVRSVRYLTVVLRKNLSSIVITMLGKRRLTALPFFSWWIESCLSFNLISLVVSLVGCVQ